MDLPGTSTMKPEKIELKDVGINTINLFKRIIRKVNLENDDKDRAKVAKDMSLSAGILLDDVISRTVRYTGIHKDNVEKMLATGKALKVEHKDVDRQKIHNELIDMYLQKKCIPTITKLFNASHHLLPSYADLDYFSTILIKMGYVFHRYPCQRMLHVMEKKSVTFKRYKYLKAIQQYRENKVPIVYIGMASMAKDLCNLEKSLQIGNTLTECVFFTVTQNEIKHVNTVPSVSFATLKMWLIKDVLHDLPPGSVCILRDVKVYRETLHDVPTLYSVKVDMVEWLTDHNIPCNIEMTKSELFDLIKSCTDTNENPYVVDNLVKTYDHILLRMPDYLKSLSVTDLILDFLNNNSNLNNISLTNLNAAFKSVSQAQLNIFSNKVQLEELRFLKEDMEVDDALDELVRNAKNVVPAEEANNEYDMVIPTFSDSD